MSLKRSLTLYDYADLARSLEVEPEALIAVANVESKGSGFDDEGFPTILFERHKFYKHANRSKRAEWYRTRPEICNPKVTPRGGYGSKADQRRKLSAAFRLDPDAAMMACSWGAFQELGENYDDYDFASVGAFVDRMKSGIDGQLDIFSRSIRRRGLIDELQRHDWAGFARNYNGPKFRVFAYDAKIEREYRSWKARHTDWPSILGAGDEAKRPDTQDIQAEVDPLPMVSTESDPAGSQTPAFSEPAFSVETPVGAGEALADPAPKPVESEVERSSDEASGWLSVEDWKPFVFRWLKRIWGFNVPANIAQFSGLGLSALNDPPNWMIYIGAAVVVFILIGVPTVAISGVLLAIWYFNRREIGAAKMEAARSLVDPHRGNLGIRIEKK